MADDIAIKVDSVSKTFKLPHEKNNSIKGALIGLPKRKKGYETQEVLKNISLEIKKGEFYGITGRNGSGKSTLLKLLAEIYTPSKGRVRINGKLTPFIELGVGFNPELTGRENVYLNGALLGFNRREMNRMYDEIVEFAELEKFMDQKLKNYSSGMQVRLAFSIAIRAKSDILLIDEVLAVGDVNFQNKCLAVFEDIKKRGTTVVFVSHDMESVRRFCDRASLIQDGVIMKTGDAQEVIDDYLALNAKSTSSDKSPFGVGNVTVKDDTYLKIVSTSFIDKKYNKINHIEDDEYIIEMKIKFHKDCHDWNPGVVLRDQSGLRITASNAVWAHYTPPAAKKGDIKRVLFKFPSILERGVYYISSNVVSQETSQFYDWDNDAAFFSVKNKLATGGLVNPPYTIEVTN